MCGIAVIRLKKPLEHFADPKGRNNPLWHFNKLKVLMNKLRNRGQCGVGLGSVKTNMLPGEAYMFREREAAKKDPLGTIFDRIEGDYQQLQENYIREQEKANTKLESPLSIEKHLPAEELRRRFDFAGDILIGHLRYTTSGEVSKQTECHPYSRRSTWGAGSMLVAGNFNIANADLLNKELMNKGQSPVKGTDTQTVIESLGHQVDLELAKIVDGIEDVENRSGEEIRDIINDQVCIESIVKKATKNWDGGYAITGVLGNGDMFLIRDPHGIRPCFYYESDELYAYSSERVTLMTAFEVEQDKIIEVQPGELHILKNKSGAEQVTREITRFKESKQLHKCSFERVYFSRGNDPDIYNERKRMGESLAPQVYNAINGDFEKAVFSFIPNTAEMGYYGLMEGLRWMRRKEVLNDVKEFVRKGEVTDEEIEDRILRNWPKVEKIALKDEKMRTFIAAEGSREQMTNLVYDISYDIVQRHQDSLVVIDDSIVRGNTLSNSIVRILARTEPKKLVVCSTAPQIRFPDCYGIDMVSLDSLIAFRAAFSLTSEEKLKEIYTNCLKENSQGPGKPVKNQVKALYEPFDGENSLKLSKRIAKLSRPENLDWNGEIEVIYLDTEDFHDCLTNSSRHDKKFGDWYFTGNYPTNAGNYFVNKRYILWYESRQGQQREFTDNLADCCPS